MGEAILNHPQKNRQSGRIKLPGEKEARSKVGRNVTDLEQTHAAIKAGRE